LTHVAAVWDGIEKKSDSRESKADRLKALHLRYVAAKKVNGEYTTTPQFTLNGEDRI